ncbi:MAG: FixH family protein [Bacteriovoracaceae bacterium]|nr:FixH family protein [Bacteriovoracaceae bacterium]
MKWIVLILLLSGCGDSPLLNHKNAESIGRMVRNTEGLSFTKLGIDLTLRWSSGCPSFDGCSLQIDLSEPLPSGSELFGELWMPSMGHGSSPFTIKQIGPSSWVFSDIYFIMAGDWQLKIKVKNDGRSQDEIRLDYLL